MSGQEIKRRRNSNLLYAGAELRMIGKMVEFLSYIVCKIKELKNEDREKGDV